MGQSSERGIDFWSDAVPVQAAETAAKGRNRNGSNLIPACDVNQILQARADVLQPALLPPVALGGEVYDVFGVRGARGAEDKHLTRTNDLPVARRLVGIEIRWMSVLELQRQPAAHDANAVGGVD